MTRSSSQSHFCKIPEFLIDKRSAFAHKEKSIFASVMVKIGTSFLFCLSSRAMLHFKVQVYPTGIHGDLILCLNRIRTESDWIRTEAKFGASRTGSECNFFWKLVDPDWIGLRKFLLFRCDYSNRISNFTSSLMWRLTMFRKLNWSHGEPGKATVLFRIRIFGVWSGRFMRFFRIRSRIGFHFCSSRIRIWIIQNVLNTF